MFTTLKYIILFQDNTVYLYQFKLFMRKVHYCAFHLTVSMPHVTIVSLSRLVQKVPSLELLHATEFSMRLV